MKACSALLTVLLLCFTAPWCPLRGTDASQVVTLDSVPPVVKKAIAAQLQDWTLSTIERYEEAGSALYAVDVTKGDDGRSFTIAEDGSLVEIEVELASTPAPVQKVVTAKVGDGTLDAVSKATDEGTVTYDVEWTTRDGKEQRFSVGADGAMLSIEVKLAETPRAVQSAIMTQTAGGQIEEIEKTFDEGEVIFDVDYTGRNGKEGSFSVSDSGKLLSEEAPWNEIPLVAQQAILAKLAGGKGVRVDRVYEGKKKTDFYFEVEGKTHGHTNVFRISPRGILLPAD